MTKIVDVNVLYKERDDLINRYGAGVIDSKEYYKEYNKISNRIKYWTDKEHREYKTVYNNVRVKFISDTDEYREYQRVKQNQYNIQRREASVLVASC